jgi:hypothetical protein
MGESRALLPAIGLASECLSCMMLLTTAFPEDMLRLPVNEMQDSLMNWLLCSNSSQLCIKHERHTCSRPQCWSVVVGG